MRRDHFAAQSVVCAANASASFSVRAIGNGPIELSMVEKRKSRKRADRHEFQHCNAQAANAGNYAVVITNAFGSVTSVVATLTVLSPNAPVITSQRKSVVSAASESVSFRVTAPAPLR